MKIWLDDVREPPGSEWVWLKTSEEAMRLLRNNHPIDFIAFDFDLGGADTAYRVAALIEARAVEGIAPPGWSIHSHNPVGALRLRGALERAESYWKQAIKEKTNGHAQAGRH